MIDVIKSYLVGLGFQVNQGEFQQAQRAINDLGRTVQAATSGMTRNFAVAATGVTAALAGVNAATAGLVTQVARADMEYQKLALRMWTTKQTAKELHTTLNAMGEDMESVAWVPELRQQYFALVNQGRNMQTPGDTDGQLKNVRSVLFEFTRLKLEVQYASEWIAYYLTKYLGGPLSNIKKQLSDFNDRITTTMPEWTKKIAKVLSVFMSVGDSALRFIKDLYDGVTRFFDSIPRGAKVALAAVLGLWAALKLNPMVLAITTFLLLLEDFYGYLDGRKSSQTLAPIWKQLIEWFKKIESSKTLKDTFDMIIQSIKTIQSLLKETFSEIGHAIDKNGVLDAFKTMFYEIGNAIDAVAVSLTKVMRQFELLSTNSKYKGFWSWLGDELGQELKRLFSFVTILAKLVQLNWAVMGGEFKKAAEIGKSIIGDVGKIFKTYDSDKSAPADNQRMMALAQKVSRETGLPAQWIYGQWHHESGGFSSNLARENFNFSGLTQSTPNDSPQPDGSMYYMHFNSPEEFAEYFAKYIKRYGTDGIYGARTVEEYAAALKRGGYYGDSEQIYASGIRNGMNTYTPDQVVRTSAPSVNLNANYSNYSQAAAPSSTGYTSSIIVGDINITQPNATPQQIRDSVTAGISQAQRRIAPQIRELKGVIV